MGWMSIIHGFAALCTTHNTLDFSHVALTRYLFRHEEVEGIILEISLSANLSQADIANLRAKFDITDVSDESNLTEMTMYPLLSSFSTLVGSRFDADSLCNDNNSLLSDVDID